MVPYYLGAGMVIVLFTPFYVIKLKSCNDKLRRIEYYTAITTNILALIGMFILYYLNVDRLTGLLCLMVGATIKFLAQRFLPSIMYKKRR